MKTNAMKMLVMVWVLALTVLGFARAAMAQAISITPESWKNIPASPSAADLGLSLLTGSPARVTYNPGSETAFNFLPDDAPQNMHMVGGASWANANFIRWSGSGTFRVQGTAATLPTTGTVHAVRMMLSFSHPTPETMAGTDDTQLLNINLNGGGCWLRFHLRNATGQAGDKVYRGAYIVLANPTAGGGSTYTPPGYDGVNSQACVSMNKPFELTLAISNSNPGWIGVYVDRVLVAQRTAADVPTALSTNRQDWTVSVLPSGSPGGVAVNLHPRIEAWNDTGFLNSSWRDWPANYDLSEYLGTSAVPAPLNSAADFDAGHVWRITQLSGSGVTVPPFASGGANPEFGRLAVAGTTGQTATLISTPPSRPVRYNSQGWAFGAVTNFLVPDAAGGLTVSLLRPSATSSATSGAVLGQFVISDQRLSWRASPTAPLMYLADVLPTVRYALQWSVPKASATVAATPNEVRWLLIDLTRNYDSFITVSSGIINTFSTGSTGITSSTELFPGGMTPRVELLMTQGAGGNTECGAVAFGQCFTLSLLDSRSGTPLTPEGVNVGVAITSIANNMSFPMARGQPFVTPGYAHRPTAPTSPNVPDVQVLSTLARSGQRLTELSEQADAINQARAIRLLTVCHSVNDFSSIASLGRGPWVTAMTTARKTLFGGALAAGNEVILTSEAQGSNAAFSNADTDWVINEEWRQALSTLVTDAQTGRLLVMDVRNKAAVLFRGSSDQLHISGEGGRNFVGDAFGVIGSGRKSSLRRVVPSNVAGLGYALVPLE